MSFNRKEVATRLALTAAIMVAGAFAPKPALSQSRTSGALEQSASPFETPKTAIPRISTLIPPTVIPDIPPQIESNPPPNEPSPDIVPFVVHNVLSSFVMQRFRNGLPENIEASITYFGSDGYAGKVVPEEGVKLRHLPNVNSKSVSYVKWLDYGEQVSFQFWVTFRKDQQLLERWIEVGNEARPDKEARPGARWKCEDGWPRAQGHCFAAAQIGEDTLIDSSNITPPPAEQVKFYPWPSSK